MPSLHLKPFLIQVNHSMPAITFRLGTSLEANTAISLVCLYDTCAAICSGNLLFHQWVVTTYPDLVHLFEPFDDSNPFEAIKLIGAVKDTASYNEDTHGRLTAMVRYFLPYTDSTSHPTVLCIALGADISVNAILGWPTIEDLGIELHLKTKSFFSSMLNHAFPLKCVATPCGLPPGIDFDPTRDFCCPPISASASASVPASITTPAPNPISAYVPGSAHTPTNSIPFITNPIPAAIFNPSSQMQALCQQLNAAHAGTHTLAPGSSDTMIMDSHAPSEPELPTLTAATSTISSYTHDMAPTAHS